MPTTRSCWSKSTAHASLAEPLSATGRKNCALLMPEIAGVVVFREANPGDRKAARRKRSCPWAPIT